MLQEVELHSLQKYAILNGKKGILIGFDKSTGRYEIKLKPEKFVKVLPDNFWFIDARSKQFNRYLQLDEYDKYFGKYSRCNWQMGGREDYHCWNEMPDGRIFDPFSEQVPHYNLTYMPWKNLHPYYTSRVQNCLQELKKKNEEELKNTLDAANSTYGNCLTASLCAHLLYKYDFKIGSCGITLKNGTTFQEFGNFRDEPDYKDDTEPEQTAHVSKMKEELNRQMFRICFSEDYKDSPIRNLLAKMHEA